MIEIITRWRDFLPVERDRIVVDLFLQARQSRFRGQAYWFTGKSGTHRASGVATREMATADDARLWITLGGTAIWED